MPQRLLIIGGGVGGTIVANVLARSLRPHEAEITLIASSDQHVYMPAWLYMPFNTLEADSDQMIRKERNLLNRRVHFVRGSVRSIDSARQEVLMEPNGEQDTLVGTDDHTDVRYPYDYLVLATGARLAPTDLEGLGEQETSDGWHHFYSTDGALHLRTALHQFSGGRIVIAVGGIPYRCPPAPLEFSFLLDDWLRQRSMRQHTEIHYLFPLPRVFPIESVATFVTPLLEERDIKYTVFFNTETVDTKRKIIASMEGEEMPYDLLILVPPHRGVEMIEASGLGDEQGWIPTDRHTLAVKGHENIYAIGDATDLPISKSGSAAHFQAKVVAHRLIASLRGEGPTTEQATYDGDVMCFLETGRNRATQLVFNYEHPPQPPMPGRYYHMEKQLLNRAYWHLVPQGLV